MRLVSRYLLRRLAAPFGYALAALTGFMLLNQIGKQFDLLAGKGLPWSAIAEVFVLSLPFILAITIPLSVLVAVLYTMSHLAADNEITALRSGGLSLRQIGAPVLLWAAGMAVLNFAFVDQVLPRTNARLRALLFDIARKRPTFQLHEQVINPIPSSSFFLRAARIDQATGGLRNVVVYDVGAPGGRRIIAADSGVMTTSGHGHDLVLTFYHGTVQDIRQGDSAEIRLTDFRENRVRVRDVFDSLQRSDHEIRGEREMSVCEMEGVLRESRRDLAQARADQAALLRRDLLFLLDQPDDPTPPPAATPAVHGYCAVVGGAGKLVTRALGRTPGAGPPAQPPGAGAGPPSWAPSGGRISFLSTAGQVGSIGQRAQLATREAGRYTVEIEKKFAISLACIPFALVALVLALRFPRAGMGLVLGGGMAVFSIFYVGLIGGEALADRGYITPFTAMWSPDLVLAVLGLLGVVLVERQSGSARGGDWEEVAEWFRGLGRRVRRRPG